MKRRRRDPIGEKLSRGVACESLHPTPTSSALCTFLVATAKRTGTGRARPHQTSGAMRLQPLLQTVLWAVLLSSPLRGGCGLRLAVYWNSSNPRLLRGDAVVELGFKDYLDIICPHYESPGPPEGPETFALYVVDWAGYKACRAEGPGAFKRWECSHPFAPFGPVRFPEKIQRFTPFSLGMEFLPGETYYYILPAPGSPGQCLRLQVSICCKEDKPESAHPVGSHGESGTSGWQGGATPSPLCLLLLLLFPILRLLRVL